MCNNSTTVEVIKYFVLQIDNSWKEIKFEDIQKYLDYGCRVKGCKIDEIP